MKRKKINYAKFIQGKGNHDDLLEELSDAMLSIRYVQLICGISDEELNKKYKNQKPY